MLIKHFCLSLALASFMLTSSWWRNRLLASNECELRQSTPRTFFHIFNCLLPLIALTVLRSSAKWFSCIFKCSPITARKFDVSHTLAQLVPNSRGQFCIVFSNKTSARRPLKPTYFVSNRTRCWPCYFQVNYAESCWCAAECFFLFFFSFRTLQ